MGKYWLHNALVPLQKALGPKLKLYSGYETRSRSTGGFEQIRGILMHHDADPTSGSDDNVLDYEYKNATDKPIGNFHVQRDGDVWWGAAGASNHAGKGGPVPTSRGTVPLDKGNLYLIGIEASNNGTGEVWGTPIMESYLTLVATLCKTFSLKPLEDIYGHWTYCEPSCPGRKIDPLGPTPSYSKFGGTSGKNKWNMQEVRKEINARLQTTPPPVPESDWVTLGRSYPTPPGTPILKKGVIHANVPWLQAILCSMNTLPEDGNKPIYNPAWVGADSMNGGQSVVNLFGDATYNALVYWESKNSLTADGVWDNVTAQKMLNVRGK